MHCSQIRQRLNDRADLEAPEIRAHVRECAECRREWEAERLLRDNLTAVRNGQPDRQAVGSAETWIDSVLTNEREHSMQSIFRHPFSTRRRRWGISLAVATVAVALFVLIPFSYEYTAGTRLTISSVDPAFVRIDGEALRAALGASPVPVRGIQRNSDGATHSLTLLVEGSRDQALAALSAVRNLIPSGLVSEVSVEPWRVRESGSLLAQIASRLIDIRLDVAGKSDAELTEDLRSQLTAQGFAPSQVNVTKSEKDGGTSVQMTFSGENPGGGEIEVKTELAGVPEGEASVAKIIMTDPNLTDAQKAAEIKRRLAEQGIEADVKVENGEVKVQAVKRK